MKKILIRTQKDQEMIDLSRHILDFIRESNLIEGQLLIFCPHTTAGLTINENADPDVQRDMIKALNKVYPVMGDYRHLEGNSHAHLKASFVGASELLMIQGKKPLLGTWQSVFFCEFDGPRTREIYIKEI